MIVEFRLPDLGEGLPEAEIVQWMVAEGDTVTLNQTIAEVETAKAIVELPSPHAGTVSKLRHAAGDVVEVGDVLIAFDVAGEAGPEDAPAVDAAGAVAPEETEDEEKAQPNLVGYGAAPRAAGRPQRRARQGARAAVSDTAVLEAAPHDAVAPAVADDGTFERPRSTPPVRKLAKDLGVDISLVEPTGPTGLVTRDDVESYAQRVGAAPRPEAPATDRPAALSTVPVSEERETRIPIRGVRKHTADAMVRSAFTAPHVTTFHTVDVTATMELVDELRGDRRLEGHRIGVMAVVAKAVCGALLRHPELNSRWDDAAGEIVQHHFVNLGIAAATDRGLVVPNVKDADAMTLVELADALGALAATARAGKASMADLTGGTFSITNFGVFGIDSGTPILNPGEAGILGLGGVNRRPWEYRGELALRQVMTLSLSFDHRLVDGEQGAKFLRDVSDVLEQPGRAMLLR